jgi:hypothetical protein
MRGRQFITLLWRRGHGAGAAAGFNLCQKDIVVPEPVTSCTKCSSDMEEGFIVDYGHSQFRQAASWIAGPPEMGGFSGVKIEGKHQLPLRTFRFTACGYLEPYARSRRWDRRTRGRG